MAARIAVCCTLALPVAGCGAAEDPASPPEDLARLVVSVDRDGPGSRPARELRVSCASARESALCTEVAALRSADLRETEPATACTDLFGGPQTARITGDLRGRPVDARFSRTNGCEIARWEKVSPLLEAAG